MSRRKYKALQEDYARLEGQLRQVRVYFDTYLKSEIEYLQTRLDQQQACIKELQDSILAIQKYLGTKTDPGEIVQVLRKHFVGVFKIRD